MKKMNWIVPLFMFLLLIGTSAWFGIREFNVLSQDIVRVGEDGEPYWFIYVSPSGGGEKFSFVANKNFLERQTFEDANGGIVVPQTGFEVEVDVLDNYCRYGLTLDMTLRDRVGSWFSGIFGQNFQVYLMDIAPTQYFPTTISVFKEGRLVETKEVNLASIGESVKFYDAQKQGYLVINVEGIRSGLRSGCPTSNNILIRWQDGSYATAGDTARYTNTEFFRRSGFSDVRFADDMTYVEASYPISQLGRGSLLMIADAEFLDFRYIPPSQATPKIVDIFAPQEIGENARSSISLRVQNVGQRGVISVNANVDNGYVSVVPMAKDVNAGDVVVYNFDLTGGLEDKDRIRVEFEACGLTNFGTDICDKQATFIDVVANTWSYQGDCGDGVCHAWQNHINCPQDCEAPVECSLPHESFYEGKCMCDVGFEYAEDRTGRTYCKPVTQIDDNLVTLIIVLVFVGLNIGIVAWWMYNKRKN